MILRKASTSFVCIILNGIRLVKTIINETTKIRSCYLIIQQNHICSFMIIKFWFLDFFIIHFLFTFSKYSNLILALIYDQILTKMTY